METAAPLPDETELRRIDLQGAELRGIGRRGGTGAAVAVTGKGILPRKRVARVQAAGDPRVGHQHISIQAIVVEVVQLPGGASNVQGGCKVESVSGRQGGEVDRKSVV